MKIVAGKDRGKTGAVLKVFPEEGKVSIEGINLYKKRVKPKAQGRKGETVLVARPLHASNVMMVCGNCKNAVRVGKRMEGNQKVGVCKKCGAII